ncbi:hypothetical protein DID88_008710 [Monilinia fructigena]|uniref:Transcription factor domain-containing protein n=1 Tax=Monilinia fructigena TaxID=38457 RepID=A0A395J6V0_9HELO|nr:hypothetical protein DID88_008710 [Monilinia fructigena]
MGSPIKLTLEEKEELIRECSVRLEEKYLKYCENAGPLYWVASTVARLIFAKMSLIIYHPLIRPGRPQCLSPHTKDRLLKSSIEVIEYSRILETEASTKKWGWLFRTYVQWHAIAFILGELSVRKNSLLVERAWQAIDSAFDDWSDAVGSSKRGAPHDCPTAVRRAHALMNDATNAPSYEAEQTQNYLEQPQNFNNHFDTNVSTQVAGIDMLAPEQIQFSNPNAAAIAGSPWLMDENALLDLDMNALDGDTSLEGWDDLARDFQFQAGQQVPDANTLGAVGNWW